VSWCLQPSQLGCLRVRVVHDIRELVHSTRVPGDPSAPALVLRRAIRDQAKVAAQSWHPARTVKRRQLLIDPEILAYCAIMAAIGLVLLALTHRHEIVTAIRVAAPGLLTACLCFGAVAGYAIWYFLSGPRRIPNGIQPPGVIAAFRVDLLRPILRSTPQLTDPSGYLGIPLLIGLVILTVWWRKLGTIRFAVACACAAFLLSLGPHLTVDGHTLGIWLPEALFEHVRSWSTSSRSGSRA